MATSSSWFDVDREGLRKLLRRRGMEFLVYELVQNAWDTDTPSVTITLAPVEGRPLAFLVVEDESTGGFSDLSHAHRLFAESEKKKNPEKRGRFNLGEKLVLAAADEATITSTTGAVLFRADGLRVTSRSPRRDRGSRVEARIRLTRAELDGVLVAAHLLLPPIPTTLNGKPLRTRAPLATFRATLATEIEDEEGYLRRTRRETEVRVYERRRVGEHRASDASRLYEMGIPVVETDDPWDVEVMQKVPLNSDRDNVTPGYLRDLRVAVCNHLHHLLPKEAAATSAVQDALGDATIEPAAVEAILTAQYGTKRAILDPSDPEANRHLIAEGYTLVPGRAHSKEAWTQIRASGSLLPAGQIRPTPKHYDPEGDPANYLDLRQKTPGMIRLHIFTALLAQELLDHPIRILFEKGRMTASFAANFRRSIATTRRTRSRRGSRYTLTFNVDRLGHAWFDQEPTAEPVLDLLLHELAHASGGHLTEPFESALSLLGAKLARLGLVGRLSEIEQEASSFPMDHYTLYEAAR